MSNSRFHQFLAHRIICYDLILGYFWLSLELYGEKKNSHSHIYSNYLWKSKIIFSHDFVNQVIFRYSVLKKVLS